MRSKYGTMLAAAVCVAALGLVVVASASAESGLPEFQQAGKPLAKTVNFTGNGVPGENRATFKAKNGAAWTCEEGVSLTGETHGSKGVSNVIIKFKGCVIGERACTSKGAKPTELITSSLAGRIGYLPKTKEVGVLLEPASGTVFAECGAGLVLKTRGSIIGGLTPTNTETTKFEVVYKKGLEPGEEELSHFEGEEVLHKLESLVLGGGSYSEMSIAAKLELSAAEKLEIKA